MTMYSCKGAQASSGTFGGGTRPQEEELEVDGSAVEVFEGDSSVLDEDEDTPEDGFGVDVCCVPLRTELGLVATDAFELDDAVVG